MVKKLSSLAFLILAISLASCNKDGVDIEYQYYPKSDYDLISNHLDLPEYPLDYTTDFPNYYTRPSIQFDNDMATLGRVLFYDINLSKNKEISCASCHKQNLAFADDVAFSEGVNGKLTDRNSLALGAVFNFSEYYGPGRVPFFWDNRVSTVEEQSEQTFKNDKEMDMEMHEVLAEVQQIPYYVPLFKAAFKETNSMTEDNVLTAISEFVNSIASVNSRYDDGLIALFSEEGHLGSVGTKDFANFTPQENIGKSLYINNCAVCHGEINGAPNLLFANNGLDLETNEEDDKGLGGITYNSEEMGTFKVPTLRNISLTGPFMHDGRFETLEDVLNHYSSNIQAHPNLSWQLRNNNQPKKFNFSTEDKAALLAFFDTFVDDELAVDERFSDPFIQR